MPRKAILTAIVAAALVTPAAATATTPDEVDAGWCARAAAARYVPGYATYRYVLTRTGPHAYTGLVNVTRPYPWTAAAITWTRANGCRIYKLTNT